MTAASVPPGVRGAGYLWLNAFPLGVSIFWNSVHPLLLPLLIASLVAAGTENGWLGAVTFVGLIVAMVVQPAAGAWSDGLRTRLGRRRPLIALGTLLALPFALSLGVAGTLAWLFLSYVLLQLVSNVALGAWQGLIPDLVAPDRRGLAAGAKNFADVLGVVIAALALPTLVTAAGTSSGFITVSLIYAFGAALTLLLTREPPLPAADGRAQPNLRRTLTALVFDPRRYPAFSRLLVSRLCFVVALTSIQTFSLFFVRDVLQAPDFVGVWGTLTQAIGVAILVVTLPAGPLADRVGRRPLILVSGLVAAGGALGLLAARDTTAVLGVGLVMGAAIGVFLSANWALATDLVPPDQAARFLGLTNLATAGGAALARLNGPAIDALNGVAPLLGYQALIGLVALLFALSGLVGFPRSRPDSGSSPA